jgi:hypothetical protein
MSLKPISVPSGIEYMQLLKVVNAPHAVQLTAAVEGDMETNIIKTIKAQFYFS